ncbi:MAG: WG repeat-containing protein [Clostridia bacterium]|nr:WG repeat-containing protein [Clostridia bacterium]
MKNDPFEKPNISSPSAPEKNSRKEGLLHRWFFAEKKEKRAYRGRAGALILLAVLIVFSLYYLGVFDVSFIERPDAWKDNAQKFYSIWFDVEEPAQGGNRSSADPDDPPKKDQNKTPDTVSSITIEIRSGHRGLDGVSRNHVYRTREELEAEGYYITDRDYDPASSELGRITFSFDFPDEFSYRKMKTRAWSVTTPDNGEPSSAEETSKTVDRPAVYLYMGYIIYDDCGKNLYIIDRDGSVLMEYDESYMPAFARDEYGRPLFYTTYKYWASVPSGETVGASGEPEYTLKGTYLTGKNYYALGYGGRYFTWVDYVEERDGRGLNFDFPASYGTPGSYRYRIGIMSPKYSTFLDGKSALVNFMNWNYYSPYDYDVPDVQAIVDAEKAFSLLSDAEKRAARESKTTPEDIYHTSEVLPYLAAYNYNEGYATVVTRDVDEEPKYEAEELRVINTTGYVMFTPRKKYVDPETDSFCSDRFLLPLSKGEDSVGHLYYDNGYLRLRKITYDKFQLDEYGDMRIQSDVDVLVNVYGTELQIPAGYTIKGYADGVVTLEKNGKYGYFRTDGTWIVEPTYKSASAFHGGIGVLTDEEGNVGAVNTDGHLILPFKYSYVSCRSDGLIAAYSYTGGWELFGVFTK